MATEPVIVDPYGGIRQASACCSFTLMVGILVVAIVGGALLLIHLLLAASA